MILTRVTDPQEMARALRRFERGFRKGATTTTEYVGFPSGNFEECVHWQPDAGVWLCRHDNWDGYELDRYWCAYGVQVPGSVSGLSITVEINFPREGIDRRVSGILAKDPSGTLVICHTGRLGGGKKGVGKTAFVDWMGISRVPVVDGDGRTTEAYPVTEIGSDRMVSQIAQYVHTCAAFKVRASSPQIDTGWSFLGGSNDEFEGTKQVTPAGSYTASCDHGIVRNRLALLLKQAGLKVGRDQARDLIVGPRQKPEVEFEIKTTCEPQHVYTAVGQLFIHSVATPAKSRVAVLPSPVPPYIRKALKSIGIHLVAYRWSKSNIHFDRLTELYPGAATSAPINPTH